MTSLLEFTLARLASRLTFFSAARYAQRRLLHSHILHNPPLPTFTEQHVILSRMTKQSVGPPSELENRVQELEEAAEKENLVLEPPSYSEEDLVSFYEDLLAISPSQQEPKTETDTLNVTTTSGTGEDSALISAIERRLVGSFPPTDEGPCLGSDATTGPPQDLSQPYQRVLSHLQSLLTRLEAVQASVAPPQQIASEELFVPLQQFFPISVISAEECEALVRVCLQARDHLSAEKTLNIMKRAGMPLPSDSVTGIMHLYASAGAATSTEKLIAQYITDTPTKHQRHLHVKAHLNATAPSAIPSTALQVLHNYELESHPAPMQTYTSVITSLFSKPSSLARAQAWDLFSHMRYVAHPQPDVLLYTLMIRACASPISTARSSEPERALDLWTEMTVDHRIVPTAGAYNAAILACARSGLKRYVNEAFRLAKEMLDSHRDARGRPAFQPDRPTFCALLEGAKRIGDLARARWILAELVRGAVGSSSFGEQSLDASDMMTVDEEVMVHVFHAYASYNPPFIRFTAPPAKTNAQASINESTDAEDSRNTSTTESTPPVTEALYPAFTHIPPQSRQEVIHEAHLLFHRILADTQPQPANEDDRDADDMAAPPDRKFCHVALTTRLLNSYMSVFYRHSSLETAQEVFWKLYDDLGVKRSARTYVEALERCGHAKKGRERQVAQSFAEQLWERWEAMENSKRDNNDQPLGPRLIERAHVAHIRTLALAGDLDKAMVRLREFVSKYPPQAVRQPAASFLPDTRSTRTSLSGARPLVRLTSNVDVPDDSVPPFLTFPDIEMLHHRLIISSEKKVTFEKIGYVKWVCKAYEWALRVRRHEMRQGTIQVV